jgi:clan AA aspartic protease
MITGNVTAAYEAAISLQVAGPGRRAETVEFAIDTGFTGFIVLPSEEIARLDLPFLGFKEATLGDGSTTMLGMFAGLVHWHERVLRVPVLETEGSALVGMRLLDGSRLTMDVLENGPVRIEPIEQKPDL